MKESALPTTCALEDPIEQMPTAELRTIAEKACAGIRLSEGDGLHLLTCGEEDAVALLADYVRFERVGDAVYYASTLYVHPTNLCELSCPMCSYYAKPGWDTAWFSTPEQVEHQIREAYAFGINEIHVVGGLWRDCDLNYYQDLFGRIKAIDPELHIKAMTPVEYDFLAKLHGISVEEVFSRMMSWGLGSLPGGGAEILVEEIRRQLAPQKITSDEYLDIVRTAHRIGLPTNVTMLFGHVEEPKHIIAHFWKVRELQDETGGFRCFVPLKYHLENNALGKREKRLREPVSLRLIYATARLMMDNIPHLKALWNYLGVEVAQEMLRCGANDFSSTNQDEKIIRMAGGVRVAMTRELIEELIEEVGRIPTEIHSGYPKESLLR